MGPNGNMNSGKLLSPKIEPSSTPRLYKVGQPEKFIPDALPSSANKKSTGNVGEAQLTTSPTQMDYQEFGKSPLASGDENFAMHIDLYLRYGRRRADYY